MFRPSTGEWFWHTSSDNAYNYLHWGIAGDIPVPGDYDGDGKDDQAVYRAGMWWINRSTAGVKVQEFGLSSDIPLTAR